MLRYLHGHDLASAPLLRDTMFRDRADQFRTRLGWEVTVDATGWERDSYDACNPLYAIWEQPDGRHGGSMRFLPTTGPTMVNDHFAHLNGGGAIVSPLIWECTRFCLARDADRRAGPALMAAGGEIMRAFGLTHLVGVFDARMIPIYRMIGASPEVVGSEGEGRSRISVGLWSATPEARERVLQRAGVTPAQSSAWFDASFGATAAMARAPRRPARPAPGGAFPLSATAASGIAGSARARDPGALPSRIAGGTPAGVLVPGRAGAAAVPATPG